MIGLGEVRDYIATLNIAADKNCYAGFLPTKSEESIGTYNLKRSVARNNNVTVRSYDVKALSFLVHWNKYPVQTEKAAMELYEALQGTRNVNVDKHSILFVEMLSEEPIPVGQDENGVNEYVIECIFYVKKEDE